MKLIVILFTTLLLIVNHSVFSADPMQITTVGASTSACSSAALDFQKGTRASVPTLEYLESIARELFLPCPEENIEKIKDVHSFFSNTSFDFSDIMKRIMHAPEFKHLTKEVLPISYLRVIDADGISFCPDNKHLLGNNWFDIFEGKPHALERNGIGCYKFSSTGGYLCEWRPSLKYDEDYLVVWNFKAKKLLKVIKCARYSKGYFSPNEQHLIVASKDGCRDIYDVNTMQIVGEIVGISNCREGVRFSPNSKYVALAEKDKVVVCQLPSGECVAELEGGTVFAFSNDGKYIATEKYDEPRSCLSIYNMSDFSLIQRYDRDGASRPEKIRFSKDSTRVLIEFIANSIFSRGCSIWDIKQGKNIFQQVKGIGREDYLSQLMISSDMRKVVEVDNLYRQILMIKDLQGNILQQMPIEPLKKFKFTPDEKHLVLASSSGTYIYDINDLCNRTCISKKFSLGAEVSDNSLYYKVDKGIFMLNDYSRTNDFTKILASVIKHYKTVTKARQIKRVLNELCESSKYKPLYYGVKGRFIAVRYIYEWNQPRPTFDYILYDTETDSKYGVIGYSRDLDYLEDKLSEPIKTCVECNKDNIDCITSDGNLLHEKCSEPWRKNKFEPWLKNKKARK